MRGQVQAVKERHGPWAMGQLSLDVVSYPKRFPISATQMRELPSVPGGDDKNLYLGYDSQWYGENRYIDIRRNRRSEGEGG